MKKPSAVALGVTMAVLFSAGFAFAQKDAKGCKDHPLFTRMPGYDINWCKDQDFASIAMYDPLSRERMNVEGRTSIINYKIQKEFAGRYTELQVARNFTNAIKAIGGNAYEYNTYNTYLNLIKDGKETWVKLHVFGHAGGYELSIVEKGAMKQEVSADAKQMAEGIGATGHVALYGIYFDFNKADIKPASEPAIGEIAKLLTKNPGLKVFIVGHTDNVGNVGFNMKLSQARADAVKKALITKYKVRPQSMEAFGVGQLAPVASNKTEDGRAKNRRVELVEQ